METSSNTTARRQASIVFADISGFTALSQKLDPEEVHELMNACFQIVERIVRDRGGTVDKYIGDCVMALFGAPQALEDAPRQALNAAIEIRNRLSAVNGERTLPAKIGVHIGVNTGLVVAGDMGGDVKRDYTVLGPAVNLAARLQSAASDDCIYVGAATYREVRGDFEFRELKPLRLKGIDEPVVAYELVSRTEKVHRSRPGEGAHLLGSALVGRDRAFADLCATVDAAKGGRGGIVTVRAENGMGKSRLLGEVLRPELLDGLRVVEGRSLSMGQTLRFHPFIDLLRAWAGVSDTADEAETERAMRGLISDVCGDEMDRDVAAAVATLMGLSLAAEEEAHVAGVEGEALEKLIRRGLRSLLERASATSPVVLVFEDLHWADQSSVALLESLLTLAATSPLLFVLVFRPSYEATSERVLQTIVRELRHLHTAIELEPLPALDCGRLMRNLLETDEIPSRLTELVQQRTEGNPFYIEEVLRSLLEEGALVREKGGVRLNVSVPLQLPGTIREVILTRVDRLSVTERRTLETASVVGRRFYRTVLEAVAGDISDLDLVLQTLAEKQFLTELESRRTASPRRTMLRPQREYVFKHALIQESVYESLLKRSRRDLHERCAAAIERTFAERPEDAYGMLAYHYARAENIEKAEEFMFKAGEEAARTAASAEALQYFSEAYRFYLQLHGEDADPDKKGLLEQNIAYALFNCGRLLDSIEHFDAALGFYGVRVPKSRLALQMRFWAELAAVLARIYIAPRRRVRSKDVERDRRICTVMYNRARAANPTDPQRFVFDTMTATRFVRSHDPSAMDQACGIHATAGAFFAFGGISFGVARRFLAEAAQLVRGDRLADQFQLRAMGTVVEFHAGDWAGAYDIDDKLMAFGLRAGLLWDADVYLGMVAEREMRKGNFAAARRHIDTIAHLRRDYGYRFSESNEAAMTAYLLLEQRRLVEARPHMERYCALREEPNLRVFGLSGCAKIEALSGQLDRAEAALADAEHRMKAQRLSPFYLGACHNARLLLNVSRVANDPGDRALAKRARRDANAAVQTATWIARDLPEACRLSGTLFAQLGDRKRAAAWWQRAIEVSERLGARPELGRTYADIAAFLSRAGGSFADATHEACYARAEEVFSDLGLEWENRRLAEAAGASRTDTFGAGAA